MNLIGQRLLKLFEHWQLDDSQKLSVLGFTNDGITNLAEYLHGSMLLQDRDKRERAAILLGIHQSLRTLFPQNRDLAYRWISEPITSLDHLSPLDVIDNQGMLGMYRVRAYLNQYCPAPPLTLESMIEEGSSCRLSHTGDSGLLAVAPVSKEGLENAVLSGVAETLALLDVWSEAVHSLGSEDKARHWIMSYLPMLGAKPIELLATSGGRRQVRGLIARIRTGDI